MSAYQRNKGNRIERYVILMHKDTGIPCERNLSQSRDGGRDVDWDLPVCLEIKGGKLPPWKKGYKQAERAAGPRKEWWACWTHEDRGPDIVHMPAELWLEMASALRRLGEW